ncbi:hypothetical protein GCM10010388_63010 [Streptomyces mauvecolor]
MDHNFWVAAPIQPLDLGFLRLSGPTACRETPAEARRFPAAQEVTGSASQHWIAGCRMTDCAPARRRPERHAAATGTVPEGVVAKRPTPAVKGTVMDRIAVRRAPNRDSHIHPPAGLRSAFCDFSLERVFGATFRKQLPLSS